MTSAIRNSLGGILVLVAMLCLAPATFAGTVGAQLNDPPSNNVLDGIYVGAYNGTNTQTGDRCRSSAMTSRTSPTTTAQPI
jgi:hypothetical protein